MEDKVGARGLSGFLAQGLNGQVCDMCSSYSTFRNTFPGKRTRTWILWTARVREAYKQICAVTSVSGGRMENAPESRRENPPSCLYQEGNKQSPGWLSEAGMVMGRRGGSRETWVGI